VTDRAGWLFLMLQEKEKDWQRQENRIRFFISGSRKSRDVDYTSNNNRHHGGSAYVSMTECCCFPDRGKLNLSN